MASRDERGNYVNDKGVTIKISEYSDGSGIKMDFYSKNPGEKGHKSIHTHISKDGSYTTQDNVNGKKEESSGSCYLTTACMKHFQENFDDNCYELTVLRWFRDNFVTKEDIKHYYEIAPLIVRGIDLEEKCDMVYDYIYDNVVDYCVKEIELGNYEDAYKRYKDSILAFEEYYARPILMDNLINNLKLVRNI